MLIELCLERNCETGLKAYTRWMLSVDSFVSYDIVMDAHPKIFELSYDKKVDPDENEKYRDQFCLYLYLFLKENYNIATYFDATKKITANFLSLYLYF